MVDDHGKTVFLRHHRVAEHLHSTHRPAEAQPRQTSQCGVGRWMCCPTTSEELLATGSCWERESWCCPGQHICRPPLLQWMAPPSRAYGQHKSDTTASSLVKKSQSWADRERNMDLGRGPSEHNQNTIY